MFPKPIAPNVAQGTLAVSGSPTLYETSLGKLYLADGYTISGVTFATNLEIEYWNGSSWVNFYNASVVDGTFSNYTTSVTYAAGVKLRARLTSALGSSAYTSELTAAYTPTGGITAFSAAVSSAQASSGFEVSSASMDGSTASANISNIPSLLRLSNSYFRLVIVTRWDATGGAPTFPVWYAQDEDTFSQAGATFGSSASTVQSVAGIPDVGGCYCSFYMQYIDAGSTVEIGSRTPTLAFTPT